MSEKRQALVVGAGRGIGRACARELARLGYQVAAVSRSAGAGGACPGLTADVATETGRTAVARLVGQLARIDAVVHAQGGTMDVGPNAALAEWDAVFASNFFSAVELNRTLFGKLEKQPEGGSVVHVSSSAAVHGRAALPYACAKAALNRYIQSKGRELAPRGIALIGLMPAAVEGDDNVWSRAAANQPERHRRVAEAQALGRMQTTEEVAQAVGFLCGPSGRLFAGCSLPADAAL